MSSFRLIWVFSKGHLYLARVRSVSGSRPAKAKPRMLVQVCYKVLLYSCIYRQINSFSKYCISFVSQAICQMPGTLMWETQSLLGRTVSFHGWAWKIDSEKKAFNNDCGRGKQRILRKHQRRKDAFTKKVLGTSGKSLEDERNEAKLYRDPTRELLGVSVSKIWENEGLS